jgi:lipopolysaccharide exporter
LGSNMEKALKIGKVSATGSYQVFIGRVLSTFILAAGSIIVGIFISESNYGLYVIAVIPASTLLLFQDWGVGAALIKYCAGLRVVEKEGDLRKIIVAGLTFSAATGVVITLFSMVMSNFIASAVFGKPESAFLIFLASVTILFSALLSVSNSIFVGFERMKLNAGVLVCHALVSALVSPSLVYLGFGALGVVVGFSVALVVSGVVAVSLVYFRIFRKLKPAEVENWELLKTLKPLLAFGVPLAIAAIISGVLPQFYAFLMASFVDVGIIGNYKIAANFAVLSTFVTVPISTVLFPSFSKFDSNSESEVLKTVFAASAKYTALFLAPMTLALMVLSQSIIGTIYGDKWTIAPLFLTFYVMANLSSVLGSLSLGNLLTGLGKTRLVLKLNLLTFCVGVPFALLLIPSFGIPGLIAVSILAGVPSAVIGLHWIWKHYKTKVDYGNSLKILLASGFAALMTYTFLILFNGAPWMMLAVGGMIFLAVYLIAIPFVGAIAESDIHTLRALLSGLGPVSKLLEIPLGIFAATLRMRQRVSRDHERGSR